MAVAEAELEAVAEPGALAEPEPEVVAELEPVLEGERNAEEELDLAGVPDPVGDGVGSRTI